MHSAREFGQERLRAFEALRIVMERVVRILYGSGRTNINAMHKLEGAHRAFSETPAWTDGKDIFLNLEQVFESIGRRVLSNESIIALKGLIYHELAHMLFAPLAGSRFRTEMYAKARRKEFLDHAGNYLGTDEIFMRYMALQDQRDEALFMALYPAVAEYFNTTAVKFLIEYEPPGVSYDEGQAMLFPLIARRTSIPQEIRDHYEALFVSAYDGIDGIPAVTRAATIKSLIDEFQRVRFPRDEILAMEILRKFAMVLPFDAAVELENPNHCKHECNADHRSGPGINAESVDQKKQSDAIKKLEEDNQQKDDDPDEGDADDGDHSDGESGQKSSGGDDGEEGEGNDDGSDDEGGDTGDETDGGSDDSTPEDEEEGFDGGDAGGTSDSSSGMKSETDRESEPEKSKPGKGAGGPQRLPDIEEALLTALEEAMDNEVLQEDIDATLDGVGRILRDPDFAALTEWGGYDIASVTPEMASGARKIEAGLRTIKLDMEQELLRGQATGRLNVRRMLHANPGDIGIFDQWTEDRESDCGVEAVLLVDLSGSMAASMPILSQTIWTLISAFQAADVLITVLGFESYGHKLFGINERLVPGKYKSYASGGSTFPGEAIREARAIIKRSSYENKVLVTLTDGGFDYTHVDGVAVADFYAAIVEEVHRRYGTTTAIVGCNGHTPVPHGNRIVGQVTTIPDLVEFMTGIVKTIIEKSIANKVFI